jgi:hypothetical protein
MKKIISIILLALCTYTIHAQNITSYKTKTTANEKARKAVLDRLRKAIKKEYAVDMQFEVDKFNIYGNYAWLQVTAATKDGTPLVIKDPYADCCHAEALYKKVKGVWKMIEQTSFSTDVWYEALLEKYNLPVGLFNNE